MNTREAFTIEEVANWLKTHDDYLIITHRRPDGDAVGSAAALAQGLRDFGKTAYVLKNLDITSRYEPFIREYWATDEYAWKNIVTVDTASEEMFPPNGAGLKDSVALGIDHHPSNTYYAHYTCLDANRGACGEIVFEILMALGVDIGKKIAESLYVAISTDTGCFSYANTTADSLRIAAFLVEAQASIGDLNKILFRTKTRSRVKLEGMIYSGIEFYFDGLVAISTLTRKMLEAAAANDDDSDDISSIPGSIDDVLIGITIREISSERDCRISVRSSPIVNSAEICSRFGGGGHAMAAGFSLEEPIDAVKNALLAILPEFLPKT